MAQNRVRGAISSHMLFACANAENGFKHSDAYLIKLVIHSRMFAVKRKSAHNENVYKSEKKPIGIDKKKDAA